MDSTYLILDELIGMLPIILCGCVLPIMVVWFVVRKKINETNARTQIVTAALEKNPDMDVEELLKKISPKKKLLKEKTAFETALGLHHFHNRRRFDWIWHLPD